MTAISNWVEKKDGLYGAYLEFDPTDSELLTKVRTWLLQKDTVAAFPGAPEVLARARAFDRAVRAVDPGDASRRLPQAIAALDAAERALEAVLSAVVRG